MTDLQNSGVLVRQKFDNLNFDLLVSIVALRCKG